MSKHTLRTLNVHNKIEGVTDNIQVNIAYEHLPTLNYMEAKEFEYELQMRLQTLLFDMDQRRRPGTLAADPSIRFIPINEALEITKHPTAKAFSNWKQRHNSRHPNAKIITRNGLVELNSLRAAIQASANTQEEAA